MVLRIRNLTLRFGGTLALNNVSFDVDGDEIVGVVGPNGAGKTALLNCISGLYQPSEGQILFGSERILGLRPPSIARLGIARTFQHPELTSEELTVREHIMLGSHASMESSFIGVTLGLRSAKQAESKASDLATSIMEFLELEQFKDDPPSGLPYGTQKMVELGRALALGPKLLMLDEPISGLSASERPTLRRAIENIHASRSTAIMLIEHDVQTVFQVCTRVIVLDHGEVLADGDPESVFRQDDVIKTYLGDTHVHIVANSRTSEPRITGGDPLAANGPPDE